MGAKTHEQIQEMLQSFQVGVIPFLKNPVTDVVNPLKLYEYCALGIPIVAMRTKELEHYSDLIDLADTHEEFLQLIQKNLNEDNLEKRKARIEFANQNTWTHRVDTLLNKISEIEK